MPTEDDLLLKRCLSDSRSNHLKPSAESEDDNEEDTEFAKGLRQLQKRGVLELDI